MRRRRSACLIAVLAITAVGVACTLNPQPLPPLANEAATSGDAGASFSSDAGRGVPYPPSETDDASSPPETETDSGKDAEASDAGPTDAGIDADAGEDAEGG